jgi:glutamine amidotransferase
MGWNLVDLRGEHPALKGMPSRAYFYFFHSYYAEPEDSGLVLGVTEYGVEFCSVLGWGNVLATQFHPEKSGPLGLAIYGNFLEHAALVAAGG